MRVPGPEIEDYVIAQKLGVSVAELLRMDIDEADGLLAFIRGREIAAVSTPPQAE